ncbi:hypothetical protein, partial [Escherichia coli]
SVAAAFEAAFSGSAGAGGAILGATIVPLLLWLAYGVFIVILQVRMLRRLNQGFGLGVGYTVLGVLLLPLWASLVGWGAAQWRGLPP